jgi:O-antigen/teichoic acid export membrane protein
MTLARRIAFAVSVSWLNRAVVIVLGLVLIPLLFRHMGQEELGLWFMLGQSGAFLGLMDFGVSPTLTRRIAFARGAGGDPSEPMSDEARGRIADLMATGRVIYRFLTAGAFLVAWTTGFIFLGQIELHELSHRTVWIAWTVMCVSHALGVWASLWNCLLQGTGHVGWDAVIGIGVQVGVLVAQIAAVLMGGGLVTLAAIAAVGAVGSRFAVLVFMRRKEPGLFAVAGRWDRQIFDSMLRPAVKAWATGLGAFLILRTDQYFIAYYKGADSIPSYQAAYQLVFNLFALSMAFAIASQVFVSQLWQGGHVEQVHHIVRRSVRFALIVMGCGIACLLASGRELMDVWLGPGHFVGYPVLGVFCLMLFLEAQHTAVAAASRSTEDEVFVWWAMGAGVLNLVLTWWLIKPLGLLGVALGTTIAQLATNNWYAVYRGLWRLRMSISSYLRSVLAPVMLVFAAAILCALAVKAALATQVSQIWVLAAAVLVTGTVCCIALLLLVADARQRNILWRKVSPAMRPR